MYHRPVRRAVAFAAVLLAAGCSRAPSPVPDAAVSIAPLAAIVRAVLPEDARVHLLAPPGASPHTYEPRPEDARAAEGAKLLVSGAANLDGWTARLASQRHWHALEAVPEPMLLEYEHDHDHSHDDGGAHGEHDHTDPHFWLDPVTTLAMLPGLAAALSEAGLPCDPERLAAFERELMELHESLAARLTPLRGKSFVVFHDSMRYLFNRYGIEVAGVIEPSPGKEPSPRDIQDLINIIRETGALAVATEPQFSDAPAAALAEGAETRLITLDPIGGVPGRMTYRELLEFNAAALLSAAS